MCGIAGWYRYSSKLTKEEIVQLLLCLETRGTDATGVAWWGKGDIEVLKSPVKASEFIELPHFKQALHGMARAQWGLLHCRAATNGSPKNNFNNHPIYNDSGLIIHNGIAYTKKDKLPAKGQTDTEQILLHIQKHGFKGIEELGGSMAFAYVDFSMPNEVYLYAHTMPLVWAYHNGLLLFASTSETLRWSLDYQLILGQIPDIAIHEVPENTVFKVNKDGITKVMEVKPSTPVYSYVSYPGWYGRGVVKIEGDEDDYGQVYGRYCGGP